MSSTEIFLQQLATFADAEAVVSDLGATTYNDLVCGARMLRDQILAAGIRAGDVVALEGSHSTRTTQALLALAELRAITVPITMVPAVKRTEFHRVGQVEWTIEVAEDCSKTEIVATGTQADHPLYESLRSKSAAGLVLFSSGTTGRSKASVLNFDLMLSHYAERRAAQRTLSFLNLDHIGGVNTLLHTLSQGGAIITIPDRTPEKVFETIALHQVSVLPTTPTFLTMTLISGAHLRHDTSSLRVLTYGTEPMPQQTLQRLAKDLPAVRLKQTYGLSELGIMATKSKANDSLWIKLGGADFDYKVIDGVLWIKSKMAMLGYLNAAAPFDDEGYFNTQDAVELDGDYLRILGRTSELINVGGEKVYPSEVESVLLEMSNIADVTVSGRPNPVTGSVVQATIKLVQPEDARSLRKRIDQHCAARLEPYKIPAAIVVSLDDHHNDRFKKIRVS
jgi:acyl-CoA synthetase (AMP-forming)/AMP-acid ligase II